MRARILALLVALVATLGLTVALQAPAEANAGKGPCGYTTDQWQRIYTKQNTNHQIDVYESVGHAHKYCGILSAENALYGVPHYMSINISCIQPLGCHAGSQSSDAGTYAYYAGPAFSDEGSYVHVVWSYTSPAGTNTTGDVYLAGF